MKNLTVFALSVLLAPAAVAQHQVLTIDPGASEVKMTLNTNHEVVHGTFHVQLGAIELDAAGHKMTGSVIVAADSGQTGNGTRDKRMNKEVLKAEQYATVSFQPKSFTGPLTPSGDSTIQVTGIFTLLDKPHDLTIPMLVHIDGTSATAKAHFAIPYVQWGLKDPSILFWKTEKEVAIDLLLAGQLSH